MILLSHRDLGLNSCCNTTRETLGNSLIPWSLIFLSEIWGVELDYF